MLTALDQHCHPNTTVNACMTLMSILKDVQGKSDPIMEFFFWFDGLVMDMSWCKIMLPPILLVMFFLCPLHGRYADLLGQFCSCFNVPETATIDSGVEDICYHDSFILTGSKKPPPSSRVSCSKSFCC